MRRGTSKTLALHHDVVESTMDADAVVPFRVGTVVEGGGLPAWAAARAALVHATLGALAGVPESRAG